jgi:PAS domain S-box-containing protein
MTTEAILSAALDGMMDRQLILAPVADHIGATTNMRVVAANRAAAQHLDSSQADLVGRLLSELIGPDEPRGLQWCIDVALTREPLVLEEAPLPAGRRHKRWVDVQIVPLEDFVVLTWRDVTARHQLLEELTESQSRFHLIAEHASDAVFEASAEGAFQWVSGNVTSLLGWRPEELVGHYAHEFVHPHDLPAMQKRLLAIDQGSAVKARVRMRSDDGTFVCVGIEARGVFDKDGRLQSRVGIWRDLSEQLAAEEELELLRAKYEMLAQHASDLVCMADATGRLEWFSDSIREYGWEPSEVVGHSDAEFLHPDDRHLLADVNGTIARGEVARVDWRIAEKGRREAWHWFRVHVHPVTSPRGEVTGRVSGWQNIDAEKESERRLVIERDRLRATIDSSMDPQVILEPIRQTDGTLLDLRIVSSNHRAGAALRVDPSAVVGHSVKEVLGAEQLSWAFQWCESALTTSAGVSVDDVPFSSHLFSAPQFYDVRVAPVGDAVSITWRNVTERHEAFAELLDEAVTSHERLAVFEPELGGERISPRESYRDVKDLLTKGGPKVALQAIVDVTQPSEPVGYEALARFPAKGLGRPDRWFAIAHRVGLGADLELRALANAIGVLDQIPNDSFLSINISPQALVDGALARQPHLPWHRLVLELTEHVPIADYAVVVSSLDLIRGRGARLAIDDAGAGYASLRHIINLKPELIKIDADIVRDVDSDPVKQAVASMLIQFGRDTNARVICEGVETEAEAAALIDVGATWMQGYLFGRPFDAK